MIAPPRRAALASLLAPALAACSTGSAGDDTFRPLVGQAGRHVMWVPTLDGLGLPMLELADVRAEDIVQDLGSGDGTIPIWAARKYGARAVGIEYDAKLSALAQRDAERAGVTDRVTMIHGDISKEDSSSATVLTLYLGEALDEKLRPTILAMRPGTRVVSNSFGMGTWEPDRTVRMPEQNPLFLWIVPARARSRAGSRSRRATTRCAARSRATPRARRRRDARPGEPRAGRGRQAPDPRRRR
jgi:hypothetical protein